MTSFSSLDLSGVLDTSVSCRIVGPGGPVSMGTIRKAVVTEKPLQGAKMGIIHPLGLRAGGKPLDVAGALVSPYLEQWGLWVQGSQGGWESVTGGCVCEENTPTPAQQNRAGSCQHPGLRGDAVDSKWHCRERSFVLVEKGWRAAGAVLHGPPTHPTPAECNLGISH